MQVMSMRYFVKRLERVLRLKWPIQSDFIISLPHKCSKFVTLVFLAYITVKYHHEVKFDKGIPFS